MSEAHNGELQSVPKEMPLGYSLYLINGQEALRQPNFVQQLDTAWTTSYLQSTEKAQSMDKKYLPESTNERIAQITNELGQEGSYIAYITYNNEVVGFFWGLPMKKLQTIDPEKYQKIVETVESADNNPHIDWGHTAYFSMMGVIHKYGSIKHTGHGFGKLLTRELTAAFQRQGERYAIARTINQKAWEYVYKNDFVLFGTYKDESAPHAPTRYIFGKSLV